MIFLSFSRNVHVREFFPAIFFLPFCRFSIFVFWRFLFFSLLFHENEGVHCLCQSSDIYFLGTLSVQSKKFQIVDEVSTMREQVVKSKDLTRQTKEQMACFFFFTNCVKNVIEKAVSICVILQQDCKVKRKLQLHNIKVPSTTVWRYVTNKGWKALKRQKEVDTSCRHGIRRVCKLYARGRPAGKLT